MHVVLRVQGRLGPRWPERLGGLRLEPQEAGETLLCGAVPDQAALHGLLTAVKVDVATLTANPALPGSWLVSGLVYDAATGRAETLVAPTPLGHPESHA